MMADWMPLRWPAQWKHTPALDFLKGTPLNCLVMEPGPLAEAAAQAGYKVVRPGVAPEGVTLLEGVWPGLRMSRFGALDAVSAGPTGDPWVDSNVWPVRLARARNPGGTIWVRTTPRDNTTISAEPFVTAMADAAIAGGQWIITLNDSLAAGVAERNPEAMRSWKTICDAAEFFASRRAWTRYDPAAVPGVLSDFTTSRSQELLNLITRTGQQYRIVLKEKFSPASLSGLKAVIDPDSAAPDPALRASVLQFVTSGGLLIAGPEWGSIQGAVPKEGDHPRYSLSTLGKGSVAIAKAPLNDAYLLANDAAILISHRHDLLRFWNGGPLSAVYSVAPGGAKAVVQVVFYSRRQPGGGTSLRIAGNYRIARLSTLDEPVARPIETVKQKNALEINLPGTAGYIALDLEA